MKMPFIITLLTFNGTTHIIKNGFMYTYGEAMKEAESLRVMYDTPENPVTAVIVKIDFLGVK